MRFLFFSKKKLPQKDSNLAHLGKKRLKICQLFLINLRTFFQSGHMGSRGNHPEFFVTTILS
jgi:hypothetical protein